MVRRFVVCRTSGWARMYRSYFENEWTWCFNRANAYVFETISHAERHKTYTDAIVDLDELNKVEAEAINRDSYRAFKEIRRMCEEEGLKATTLDKIHEIADNMVYAYDKMQIS